jgi:hypothetical protein
MDWVSRGECGLACRLASIGLCECSMHKHTWVKLNWRKLQYFIASTISNYDTNFYAAIITVLMKSLGNPSRRYLRFAFVALDNSVYFTYVVLLTNIRTTIYLSLGRALAFPSETAPMLEETEEEGGVMAIDPSLFDAWHHI